MSTITIETTSQTESIPVNREATPSLNIPTPRELNLALADKYHQIAEDAGSPDRISAISKEHFYRRAASEASTDEMREDLAAQKTKKIGGLALRKAIDVIVGK